MDSNVDLCSPYYNHEDPEGENDLSDRPQSEPELKPKSLATLEELPNEILHDIGVQARFDCDLTNLCLASRVLADRLSRNSADIWRRRFLARYDHPFIKDPSEFAIAYKLRRLVLRKFNGFEQGDDRKCEILLETIVDMILEAYNGNEKHILPERSKNLAAMTSPGKSSWILVLMRCALYGVNTSICGRPNRLFDSIQVTLSHLVFNIDSPIAIHINTDRSNYDLIIVYRYNMPFELLLASLPESVIPTGLKSEPRRIFPNLISTPPPPSLLNYKLDMHALLHVRNFWQRHLNHDDQSQSAVTYNKMARPLARLGKMPKEWSAPVSSTVPLAKKWYGMYSCIHPWPKNKKDLDERPSNAEDWSLVDPIVLDLKTSPSNDEQAYWPECFSKIPVFERDLPIEDAVGKKLNLTYLRGVAPFANAQGEQLEIKDALQAMRVHGIVHDVPEDAIVEKKGRHKDDINGPGSIPGWKRIVLVMWKPSLPHLISVLQEAEGDYGTTEIDDNIASIWNSTNTSDSTIESIPASNNPDPNSIDALGADQLPTDIPNPTQEQIQTALRHTLTSRLSSYTSLYHAQVAIHALGQMNPPEPPPPYAPSHVHSAYATLLARPAPPSLWSLEHIQALDDAYTAVKHMTWGDGSIEYAYAYEGIIIPGGKIMMGRWWRCHGEDGLGMARECTADGSGVEVRVARDIDSGKDKSADLGANAEIGSGKHRSVDRYNKLKDMSEKSTRRSKRRSRKRKRSSEDDTSDETWAEEKKSEGKKKAEVKYEFWIKEVGKEEKMVQVNPKGMERGPFVFWCD